MADYSTPLRNNQCERDHVALTSTKPLPQSPVRPQESYEWSASELFAPLSAYRPFLRLGQPRLRIFRGTGGIFGAWDFELSLLSLRSVPSCNELSIPSGPLFEHGLDFICRTG